MPEADFNTIKKQIKNYFNDEYKELAEINCEEEGYCSFPFPCHRIHNYAPQHRELEADFSIHFTLQDHFDPDNQFTISLNRKDLLRDGKKSGDGNQMIHEARPKDADMCFIPLMADENLDQHWLMGNMVLNKYYTVFDMSQVGTDGVTYNRIGIAVKNEKDIIGDSMIQRK